MTLHTPAIWPHQYKTLNAVLGALWLGDHWYVLEQHPSLIFAPFALCHVYEHCLICSQSLWGFTFTHKACRWVTAHKHRLLHGHIKTRCNLLTVNHFHGSILSYFSWQTGAGFQNLDVYWPLWGRWCISELYNSKSKARLCWFNYTITVIKKQP